LLRRAVLVRANLTETGALTAALIAAVLTRTADNLVAGLAHAEVLGAWKVIGDADATALGATGRPFDAEDRRTRVVIDRLTNSGAVRAAGDGIATVAWIVDALEPVGTWETGQPAAHAARSRDLRGTPAR